MHEISLMQDVMDTLRESAIQHGINRITVVKLVIGKMTMVLPDSLFFAFEALKQDQLFSDARLLIDEREAVCGCQQCNNETPLLNFQNFTCPVCGSSQIEIISGTELHIEYFEGE